MKLHDLILQSLAKAHSQRPKAEFDIWADVLASQPDTPPDALPAALAALTQSRVLATCRITRDGISQDTYWPTGLKHPTLTGALPMTIKRPEAGSSTLLRAIVAHGPIIGADLAEKTGIASKSIDAVLDSPHTRDRIVTRKGFCAEKGRELKHYMTHIQAEAWDANEADWAKPESMDDSADAPDQAEPAAHVMSAPIEEPKIDDAADAPPPADAAWLAAANSALNDQLHTMKNDVAAANLIFAQLSERLQVEKPEDIPAAIDAHERTLLSTLEYYELANEQLADLKNILVDLEDLLDVEHRDELISRVKMLLTAQPTESTVSKLETVQPGRLALLLIDSDELTELEELDAGTDISIAQAAAMSRIDRGHAARAVVVRIFGEAARSVEWKQAA